MRIKNPIFFGVISLFAGTLPNALSQDFSNPPAMFGIAEPATQKAQTTIDVLADVKSVPAGETFNLVVKFTLEPHWHVYWKNPGAVGAALSIDWQNVPAGVSFGEWTWSAPKSYNQEGFVNYVFEREGFVKIPVTLAANVPAGALNLSGKANWLACDASGCFPAEKDFSVSLTVAAGARAPANNAVFIAAEKTFPQANVPAKFTFSRAGNALALTLVPEKSAGTFDFASAEFFPEPAVFNSEKTSGPVKKNADGSITFSLELNEGETFDTGTLAGVLRLKDGRAFRVSADLISVEQGASSKSSASSALAEQEWIAWTLAKQNEFLEAGKIVYVDFTARWCVTCQVNKRVYRNAALSKKLADAGVVLMRADWTLKEPEIAAELAKYNRAAVPFNLFLKKGQEPFILPATFSGAGTVADALDSVLAGVGNERKIAEASGSADAGTRSLVWLVFVAFLGGLILNLMPCVFPVLGLKIMHFVGKAGDDKAQIARHGLVFGLGVLVSFWVLAGILITLRSGGAQLGWGFQLQSPIFVFAMVLLMFVFGLSMSGVFEFGVSATGTGGSLTQKTGYAGTFFSGTLAVIIATPCAAPFLAPALGAALALAPLPSLGLFTCIAFGLAFPYVLLSFFPQFLKFLPKPGEWMESFKQAMAFLLYAPAAYFLWVLMGQIEDSVAQRDLLLSLAFIALACWIYGRWGVAWKPAKTRIVAKAIAFVVFAGTCAYAGTLLVSAGT